MSLYDLVEACNIGDLAKVTQLIHNGLDVNHADYRGRLPLYRASLKGHLAIVNKLIDAGADVNTSEGDGRFPLMGASTEGHAGVVEKLLASGANVNQTTDDGRFPLLVASRMGHAGVVEKLLASGANMNQTDERGIFPLLATIALPREYIEIVNTLIAHGADVNKRNRYGEFPLLLACHQGYLTTVEKLLASGADINMKYNNKSIKESAEQNTYSPEINDAILGKTDVSNNDGKMWKGFTQSDISTLDTIFDTTAEPGKRPPAENWSMCPVCLKYSERSTGCKYMHHNCTAEGGYYHKTLYTTYKTPEGMIYWCTICGRICNGHRHYELASWKTKPSLHAPGGDPFSSDCRGAEGGGGLEEKLARFRRFREYAYELQDEINKIRHKDAMNELVQETWNGPFVAERRTKKVGETKKWNIPTTSFRPNIRPINNVGNIRNYPNVTRSNENVATLRPTTTIEHNDVEDRDTTMIQFHHRQGDGSINHHEDNLISQELLIELIDNQNRSFGTEEFGMCYDYPRCTARLYPDEIKDYVSDERYETYKKHFNKKFAVATQGGRRKTRKQKGGFHNILVEAKLASCSMPKKGGKQTRKRKVRRG